MSPFIIHVGLQACHSSVEQRHHYTYFWVSNDSNFLSLSKAWISRCIVLSYIQYVHLDIHAPKQMFDILASYHKFWISGQFKLQRLLVLVIKIGPSSSASPSCLKHESYSPMMITYDIYITFLCLSSKFRRFWSDLHFFIEMNTLCNPSSMTGICSNLDRDLEFIYKISNLVSSRKLDIVDIVSKNFTDIM